jgi:hypothetical protein
MNLLVAGARSCATAIFFTMGIATAQLSPTPATSEPTRKVAHRNDGHGAEAVPCKRCSKDNVVAPTPASPAVSALPQKPDLKSYAIILEANDKNEISLAEPLGAALKLTLFVKEQLLHQQGELRTTTFISQGEQQSVGAATKIQLDPKNGPTDTPVSVDLSKQGTTPFAIYLERLRPGKIYKGQLILTAGGSINQWNVTLTTERGVLAVDPVGTLKFVRWPWQDTGEFLFTLNAGAGPYHHLRARFEPATGTNSKATTSNFSLDKLSFQENGTDIDLARRGPKSDGTDESALTLTKARTFLVRIKSLSPGEYSGALHFAADETSDDAAEAKLPLLIQVRDNVLIPVAVIFFSSLLGWFGSKYLVGVRRSRVFLRQIKVLRERADTLGRREPPSDEWRFPSESTSLGFARLGVELSLLGKLAHSVIEVVFHGDEIDARLKLAEVRLVGLESMRQTRLGSQPCANGRPAAQQAIGIRLRKAANLLDAPNFTDVEQANLKKLLEEINCWLNKETSSKEYQKALVERLQSDRYPSQPEIKTLTASSTMYARLDALTKTPITDKTIADNSDDAKALKRLDETITWAIVLWREHHRPWAEELAKIDPDTSSLDDLFYAVDRHGWEVLNGLKNQLRPNQVWPNGRAPQTYEVVEIQLGFESPSGFDLQRLRFHPSQHVQWKISEETWAKEPRGPTGTPKQLPLWRKVFQRSHTTSRDVETDSFTLVQYFLSAGKVKVTAAATLRWKNEWRTEKIDETIDIDNRFVFNVKSNPEYGKKLQLADLAAIGIAVVFAIATAIGTQYDSTFGSLGQYLAIFVWAVGAAAGGNLFTQLGANSSPGGAVATVKGP